MTKPTVEIVSRRPIGTGGEVRVNGVLVDAIYYNQFGYRFWWARVNGKRITAKKWTTLIKRIAKELS